MPDAITPWNGQQIIAQNAQYSQAAAQARLNLQEINDQSRLEQQLKQMPRDLSAMQQLEQIQSLALANGRLDAAEKASSMIGILGARTEASALKAEQAAKAREQTQKAEKDDILDLMSSSTDASSWDMNRTLALSLHPETAKSMFAVLSKPFDAETVKQLGVGRMNPAQRAKAQQEEAAAQEQAAREKLIREQITALTIKERLDAARAGAENARDYSAASLNAAKEAREKQLAKDEIRHGGKNIGKLDAPSTVEIKDAQTHLSNLGLKLSTSESAVAASDMAAHAKALQLNSPGKTMTWEEAMQRAMQEFKGQFVTEKSRWGRDKTSYVPRPSAVPGNFQATAEKPTAEDIAHGAPEGARIWIDPKTKQRMWSDD